MSNPAELISSFSSLWTQLLNFEVSDDILWNISFYGMLISVILPVALQISRPYTFVMDSLYLLFSQDILQMFSYWGKTISEPFKYLAGEKTCQYFLLGNWNQVECHILLSQNVFSTLALIGYGISVTGDYTIYQGTTLPTLKQRQDYLYQGDN